MTTIAVVEQAVETSVDAPVWQLSSADTNILPRDYPQTFGGDNDIGMGAARALRRGDVACIGATA